MERFRQTAYSMLTMVAALVSLLVVSACEHDFYETGDSELSYLHTDFVEARTNELGAFVSAKTDDGEELTLSPAVKEQWATRPDTTYRALLYYDRVEKGVTTSFALNSVLVLRPHLTFDLASVRTDPLGFESLWMSKNRKYLNLTLVLRKFYLRLYHSQNRVPEYYSKRVYTSIPLTGLTPNDVLCLDINTYKGVVRKEVVY